MNLIQDSKILREQGAISLGMFTLVLITEKRTEVKEIYTKEKNGFKYKWVPNNLPFW